MIMGLITTSIISFVLISIHAGYSKSFLLTWLRSWALSFSLAFLSIMFIAPKVQLFVSNHFGNGGQGKKQ